MNMHGDNCCQCNMSAVLLDTYIHDADIIYANFASRVTYALLLLFVWYNSHIRHLCESDS